MFKKNDGSAMCFSMPICPEKAEVLKTVEVSASAYKCKQPLMYKWL